MILFFDYEGLFVYFIYFFLFLKGFILRNIMINMLKIVNNSYSEYTQANFIICTRERTPIISKRIILNYSFLYPDSKFTKYSLYLYNFIFLKIFNSTEKKLIL